MHPTKSLGCSDLGMYPPRGCIYVLTSTKSKTSYLSIFDLSSLMPPTYCIALLIVERGEERRGGNKLMAMGAAIVEEQSEAGLVIVYILLVAR
jgi:hypothetical protein